MPATRAEMIAWQLGQTMAENPTLELQPPNQAWTAGMIPMSDDRLQAAEDLGYELFFEWVARGHRAKTAEMNHA